MIFSVDLDSTLNNVIYAWIDYINEREENKISISDIKTFDEPILLKYSDFLKQEELYRSILKPLDGAKDFIENLLKIGTVQIVSITPIQEETKRSFVKKYFNLDNDSLSLIMVKEDKLPYLKDTILIDDKLQNVIDHNNYNNGVGIVFNNDEYLYNCTDDYFSGDFVSILKYVKENYG